MFRIVINQWLGGNTSMHAVNPIYSQHNSTNVGIHTHGPNCGQSTLMSFTYTNLQYFPDLKVAPPNVNPLQYTLHNSTNIHPVGPD